MFIITITKDSATYFKNKFNVNNIFDFLDMDNKKRINALKYIGIESNKKIMEIANVCNKYPNLDIIKIEFKNNTNKIIQNENNIECNIVIERDDIINNIPIVYCLRYPMIKKETWFLF